jgi:hypothetical protein
VRRIDSDDAETGPLSAVYGRDSYGRMWSVGEGENGVQNLASGGLTPPEKKAAFQVRMNVEAFVEHFRPDHCLFYTQTALPGTGPKEFGRRINSFLRHRSAWMRGFIRVTEPQPLNGMSPHHHNLSGVDFDVRPEEFDWDSFALSAAAWKGKDWGTFKKARAAYVESAAPELRELWKMNRPEYLAKGYGLGRAEFLPVRKFGAIPEYLGKYLEVGLTWRTDAWKGVRRVECDRRSSQEWKHCSRVFAWVSPGAKAFRERVAELARVVGAVEWPDLRRILGRRWAWRLKGSLVTGSDAEFADMLNHLACERIFNPRLVREGRAVA